MERLVLNMRMRSAIEVGDLAKVTKLIDLHGLSYSPTWLNGYDILCCAIRKGRTKISQFLLSQGCEINRATNEDTPLILSIKVKKPILFKTLLDMGANVHTTGYNGNSPLHYAVMANFVVGTESAVEMLLNRGAFIDAANAKGETAIHHAITTNQWPLVRFITNKGAIIDLKTVNGSTALHAAIRDAKEEDIEHLLYHGVFIGAGVKSTNDLGFTPLDVAIKYKKTAIAYLLLDFQLPHAKKKFLHAVKTDNLRTLMQILRSERPDVNNEENRLIFNAAFHYSDPKIVLQLIEYGFKVNVQYVNIDKILMRSIEMGCVQVVEDILKFGANSSLTVHALNALYTLHAACKHFQLEIASLLINFGLDVNSKDGEGKTPIFYASEKKNIEMIELLVNNNADPTEPDVLTCAVSLGTLELVKTILLKGANVNAMDSDGKCAIHCVASRTDVHLLKNAATDVLKTASTSSLDLVNILLEFGTKVDTREYYKRSTALHLTSAKGDADVVSLLCKKGAKVNVYDKARFTPIHFAANNGHTEVVAILCKNGARVDVVNEHGRTPLHLAAAREHNKVVALLCKIGASVDLLDNDGQAPIHLAATSRCSAVVDTLCKNGAYVDILDTNGESPLHLAATEKHADVIETLLENGADIKLKCLFKCTAIHHVEREENEREDDYYADEYEGYGDEEDDENRDYDYEDCIEILKHHRLLIRLVKNQAIRVKAANQEFVATAMSELDVLKTTRITDNSSATFYSFLRKSTDQLVALLRNDNLCSVLDSAAYRAQFPTFATLLSNQYHRGKFRLDLFKRITACSYKIFPCLTVECVEEVLRFLRNEDLMILAACLK